MKFEIYCYVLCLLIYYHSIIICSLKLSNKMSYIDHLSIFEDQKWCHICNWYAHICCEEYINYPKLEHKLHITDIRAQEKRYYLKCQKDIQDNKNIINT